MLSAVVKWFIPASVALMATVAVANTPHNPAPAVGTASSSTWTAPSHRPQPVPVPVELPEVTSFPDVPAETGRPSGPSSRTSSPKPQVQEDSAGWNCARNGNRVCGPGNPEGAKPGCYRGGVLVVPWTHFERDQYGNPSSDPLWARIETPC